MDRCSSCPTRYKRVNYLHNRETHKYNYIYNESENKYPEECKTCGTSEPGTNNNQIH